jgi:hypothetical protein
VHRGGGVVDEQAGLRPRLDVLLRVQSDGLRVSDACELLSLKQSGLSFAGRFQPDSNPAALIDVGAFGRDAPHNIVGDLYRCHFDRRHR